MTLQMILLFDVASTGWGLLTSVLGSLIVVIILFVFFRPRIRVRKEIAIDENGRMTFCFRNASLSSCFNINVAVAVVDEKNNEDENEATITLERNYGAYIAGRFGQENDSEICVNAADSIKPIPPHLRIIISAQHAISGLTSVTTRDFVASDAKKGKFEKGIFVPEESTYGQVYTRDKIKKINKFGWVFGIFVIIATILFHHFIANVWTETLLCLGILLILWFLIGLLLYVRVLSRVNAFSPAQKKTFNFLSIAIGRHENSNKGRDVEDVVPTEVK